MGATVTNNSQLLPNKTAFWGILLLILAVALAFRLPQLERRPMHTDEAVHAIKAGELIESGTYSYDRKDYHGPTIYYFALPFVWMSGADNLAETREWMFRIVPVLFGAGLILLVGGIADGLGRAAALVAGALTAVSPAMVFYSRYYIQETLLVFFTFGLIVAAWRYSKSEKLRFALLAGACLGLMHATKETCIITFAAMAAAWGLTAAWFRYRPRLRTAHLVGAAVFGVLLSALLMSAFLTNPRGILDSWLAYGNYLHRADGAGLHAHPWYYYLQMLLYRKYAPGPWWSEAFIVGLAVIGLVFAFRRKAPEGDRKLLLFLATYTVLTTLAYSIIPYKTPWSMLSFLHGMILLAGVGAVAVFRSIPWAWTRVVVCGLLVIGTVHLGKQAYRGSFIYYADTRNPYVYSHTSSNLLRLADRVDKLTQIHPDGTRMVTKVMAPEYWPLPWYFRKLERVGYWNGIPEDPDAAVIITSPELQPRLDGLLRDRYSQEYYGLRPEVLIVVYIQEDLWNSFLEQLETEG